MTRITLIDHDKPLRRDAERNRQRILDAAAELFGRRGLGVTLNDIAHHAGVGVGTAYRRFPNKEALIEELFERRIEEVVGLMEAAVADPDPWRGLTRFMEQAVELQARDCALRDLVVAMPDGLARVGRIRARMMPLGQELVRRAHASGRLHPDISPVDLPIVQLMVSSVIDATREVDPEQWRRYLAIMLRGFAAEGDPRPLAPAPLAPEHVDRVMSHLKRRS